MGALTLLLLAALAPATVSQPIVGGEAVLPGDWPDVAAVVYEGGVVGCTGVLVHHELVLTARHCVFQGRITEVALETVDLAAPGERLEVAALWAAPEGLDAAVLLLARPAASPPRRLAVGCALDALRDGARATIAGWGATDAGATQWGTRLRSAEVPITDAACTHPEVGCLSGRELVAGGEGPDSCQGDSGGPLYLHTPWGPLLAGLTSRGVRGSEDTCGQGGIYVRLDALRPWVEATTGRPLRQASCGPNHAPLVSAPPLEVDEGSGGQVRLTVSDEDMGDLHRFELVEPPAHGEARVEADGTLHYQPRGGFTGEDRVGVRVTDDGVPALSTRVEILLSVLPVSALPPQEPEPGCSASGGGPLASLALLALLRAWRRSTQPARGLAR